MNGTPGERSVGAGVLEEVAAALLDELARVIGAPAAAGRGAERRLDVGKRPGAVRHGRANFAVGYGVADADVHDRSRY